MAGASSPAYACACLNVRIHRASPPPASQDSTPPAAAATENEFTRVYVGDEGISILSVYRVHQVVSLDADSKDGPSIPAEDWVERDILKSSSGWIEVHRRCLTGKSIAQAQSSLSYSPLFSMIVPTITKPVEPPTLEEIPPMSYLTHLTNLFLPPPFTPSHPVFSHLASLAKIQSDARRAALDQEIADFVRAKTAELAHTEAVLRSQVEALWRKFHEGLEAAESLGMAAGVVSPRSPRSPGPGHNSRTTSISVPASSVTRDFEPLPVPPTRSSPPVAIASSLLTRAGQHLPRAAPATPIRPPSAHSGSSRTLTGSSPTLAGSPHVPPRPFEGSSVIQFRRQMDEEINTVASYRCGTTPQAGPSKVNGTNGTTEKPQEPSPTKDKGKRKVVTFDSQPAVVTIKREVKAEIEEEKRLAQNESEEMVFDLETDDDGQQADAEHLAIKLVEPEQPRAQQIRASRRKVSDDPLGLPQSFAALRSASMPIPSTINKIWSTEPSNDEELHEEPSEEDDQVPEMEVYDSRDLEIRKMVGASLPSHRRGWSKNGVTWKSFVTRGRAPGDDQIDADVEAAAPPVANGLPGSMPIAMRSLTQSHPVLSLASYRPPGPSDPRLQEDTHIPSSSVRKQLYIERDMIRGIDPGALDFATDDEDEDGLLPAPAPVNVVVPDSTLSPHPNDMTLDTELGADDGSGRQLALKILQARNELPDSGMWRSLAS
ncbi:unnamed protein product [Mycena citricolor]|uniref:Uncharacterized protein n=1 Tax=Mycena citricolor TaxID=2018698 RepID=A0AAD2GTI8_9AGAR|nr:unnamed protein product [Mycena citricolor]